MGEDRTEATAESGYVTTEVAAAGLGVSPRTVRDYIKAGRLEAKPQGEGVERRWLVSIDSLHALRQSRQSSAGMPRNRRQESRGGEDAANLAVDLIATVQDLQYRLGRAEARAELTERTESTVREERDRLLGELERERRRVEALEAELEALRASEKAAEASEEASPRSRSTGGDYASAERPQPRVDWPSGSWHTPETDVRGPGEAWDSRREEEPQEPEERLSWWRRWFGG